MRIFGNITVDRNRAVAAIVAAGAFALVTLPVGAADALSSSDKEFMKNAVENDLAEIALGELGQKKGSTDEVKMTGEHLVKDHKKSIEELVHIAGQKNVELATEPTSAAKRVVEGLEKLEGAAFDKEFNDAVAKSHKKAISMFEKAGKDVKDPDLGAFARKSVPKLKEHLEMAKPDKSKKDKDKEKEDKAKDKDKKR